MKRKLTAREWMLLGVLAVLALASGYIMLFYTPMTQRRDAAIEETAQYQEQVSAAQLRMEEKRRMEQELETIFENDPDPIGLARYDNIQPVMMELHTILSAANDYSLSFSTVDAEGGDIVRRDIALSFISGTYEEAKAILQSLKNSAYRCMIDTVNISFGQEGDGVTVNGTIAFFEYQ